MPEDSAPARRTSSRRMASSLDSSARRIRERTASIFKRGDRAPSSSLKNMGVTSADEARFVFAAGLLLSLNAGYINGLCLGGLLAEGGSIRQGVSAFTGTYTKSGLALANGEVRPFGFEVSLILSFVGGAAIAGLMNPQAVPHKLVPSYGPTFLMGSACMIAASIAAEFRPEGRALFYFAAVANGIQNGMTSTYSANLIRTTHLTGTSTDIGLIVGQMLRGNMKNYWKFKVLVGLASSFWLGGLVSFYSASAFLSHSLWFSAGLFLIIGMSHVTYVVLTQRVSFVQACVGNWKWDRVLEQMATTINDDGQPHGGPALTAMTEEQVDRVFDEIDGDGSGEIDADELRGALERMGIKLTGKDVRTMIAVVDENGDGVVDREEFHALVGMATARARQKQVARARRRSTIQRGAAKASGGLRSSWTGKGKLGEVSEEGSRSDGVGSGGGGEGLPALPDGAALRPLPKTYRDALPKDGGDERAIVVTEARHPFPIVGVNGPWEDLCGYKSEEAVDKSMSDLIQGPRTNREGLQEAMDRLNDGAARVECTTVNYRKDKSMFKNHLTMGPLYDEGCDVEEGKTEPSYFVGVLVNIGELTQDLSNGMAEEREEKMEDDDFQDEPCPAKVDSMV